MKKFTYIITDPIGIHARPAGSLVKAVKVFGSAVTVTGPDGKSADAKKLLALMSLGIRQGSEITVSVEGEDEDSAAAAIEQFLKENL